MDIKKYLHYIYMTNNLIFECDTNLYFLRLFKNDDNGHYILDVNNEVNEEYTTDDLNNEYTQYRQNETEPEHKNIKQYIKYTAYKETINYLESFISCHKDNFNRSILKYTIDRDILQIFFNNNILSCKFKYLKLLKHLNIDHNKNFKFCTFQRLDKYLKYDVNLINDPEFFILNDDMIKLLKDVKIKPIIL